MFLKRGLTIWLLASVILLFGLVIPAMQVAKGVGTTDLEIVFAVTDENGQPVPGANVELVEVTEGPLPKSNKIVLTTNDEGIASHSFANVIFTNATDVFGREVDYIVNLPSWEVSVSTTGSATVDGVLLRDLAKDRDAKAQHVGTKKAKLEIPIRLPQ